MRDGDYDVSSSDYKVMSSCDIQVAMPNSQGEHFETILKKQQDAKGDKLRRLLLHSCRILAGNLYVQCYKVYNSMLAQRS